MGSIITDDIKLNCFGNEYRMRVLPRYDNNEPIMGIHSFFKFCFIVISNRVARLIKTHDWLVFTVFYEDDVWWE